MKKLRQVQRLFISLYSQLPLYSFSWQHCMKAGPCLFLYYLRCLLVLLEQFSCLVFFPESQIMFMHRSVLITLIGLAAKNAILIVEFAKVRVDRGEELIKSTLEAVKLRLRPISYDFDGFYFRSSAACFCHRCRRHCTQDHRLYCYSVECLLLLQLPFLWYLCFL